MRTNASFSRFTAMARVAITSLVYCSVGCASRNVRDDVPDARDVSDGGDVGDALDSSDAYDAVDVTDDDAADVDHSDPCAPESMFPAAVASEACTIAPESPSPGTACGGLSPCPISQMHRLACPGTGYGPWVARWSSAGATVLYVTNTGEFLPRLFHVGNGMPARAEDLHGANSASNALTADAAGDRFLFLGEMPEIQRLRDASGGWMWQSLPLMGGSLAIAADARSLDPDHLYVAYLDTGGARAHLARSDHACWSLTDYPTPMLAMPAFDVDAAGNAWLGWFTPNPAGPSIELLAPDGVHHHPWHIDSMAYVHGWDRPRIVVGGLDGTDALPAVATDVGDAISVAHADATGAWSTIRLDASAQLPPVTDCPSEVPGAGGCGGTVICSSRHLGGLAGFDVARTSSGRFFVAWIEIDATTDFTLRTECMGTNCSCRRTRTSSRGTSRLVVERVTAAGSFRVMAIPFDSGGDFPATTVAVTTRGDTLLVAAQTGIGAGPVMHYAEIDTTSLP